VIVVNVPNEMIQFKTGFNSSSQTNGIDANIKLLTSNNTILYSFTSPFILPRSALVPIIYSSTETVLTGQLMLHVQVTDRNNTRK
jgi:hypothetical protein